VADILSLDLPFSWKSAPASPGGRLRGSKYTNMSVNFGKKSATTSSWRGLLVYTAGQRILDILDTSSYYSTDKPLVSACVVLNIK
jgi:hypothetical protein